SEPGTGRRGHWVLVYSKAAAAVISVLGRRELYRGGGEHLWRVGNRRQKEYEIVTAQGCRGWGKYRLESGISCVPANAAGFGCIVRNQSTRTHVKLSPIRWIGNIKHPVGGDAQFIDPPILRPKTLRVDASSL